MTFIRSSQSVPAFSTFWLCMNPPHSSTHIPVHSALSNIYSWITARHAAPSRGLYFGDALSGTASLCFLWKSPSFHWPFFCSCWGKGILVLCVFSWVRLQSCVYIVDPLRCTLYSGDTQQLLHCLFASLIVIRGNSLMTSGRCDPVAIAQGSAFAVFVRGGVAGVISCFWWNPLAVKCKMLLLLWCWMFHFAFRSRLIANRGHLYV